MRLCKVHLFDGCQKWQRNELQLWRGQSLGDHHCQTHMMPFEDGSELITSLNGPTGSTNCSMPRALTSSHPTLPILPPERTLSQSSLQPPRGGERGEALPCGIRTNLSALWLPTSPISMQIPPFVSAKLPY